MIIIQCFSYSIIIYGIKVMDAWRHQRNRELLIRQGRRWSRVRWSWRWNGVDGCWWWWWRVSEFRLMVRISSPSSSSCSVRDNRQWYNNSGNYQGSNQYVRWKPNGEYSVENIIIYDGGGRRLERPEWVVPGRSMLICAFFKTTLYYCLDAYAK